MTDDRPDWPVDLRGVTESLVTTQGPDGRWNVAALGLYAGDPVTARTWGRTRTRHNFEQHGAGHVQFSRDPVAFVDAACSVTERSRPILESADAWVRVDVAALDDGRSDGTEWVKWALRPREVGVERRVVPATNRGYNAVIEATVAASRLDVEAYDSEELRDRLSFLVDVVERCGGPREQAALERLREHADVPR